MKAIIPALVSSLVLFACASEDFPRSQGVACIGDGFTEFSFNGNQQRLCSDLPRTVNIQMYSLGLPEAETEEFSLLLASSSQPAENHIGLVFKNEGADDSFVLIKKEGGDESEIGSYSFTGNHLDTTNHYCIKIEHQNIDSAGQVTISLYANTLSCAGEVPDFSETLSTFPPYSELWYQGTDGVLLDEIRVNQPGDF